MGRYLYLLHCKHQVGGTKPAPIAQYWQAKGYRRRGTIDTVPETLNLKSKAEWVTCYIKPPDGQVADDIDVDTVRLEGSEAQRSSIRDGVLVVKFDRQDLIAHIESMGLELPDDVTLTVTWGPGGEATSDENDTIRAVKTGRGPKK